MAYRSVALFLVKCENDNERPGGNIHRAIPALYLLRPTNKA